MDGATNSLLDEHENSKVEFHILFTVLFAS